VAPLFAGGTVYAWSEILEAAEIPGRSDVGALRILTRATCDIPCTELPAGDGVILELDYWALMVR
jgi:2-methylfumaryl-CoA hydratase